VKSLVILLLLSVSAAAQNTFPAIGLWREHLPYQGTIDITASNSKIYAATPYSLFSVDIETKEIERFSTVSGLSETGVSAISYDAISKNCLWLTTIAMLMYWIQKALTTYRILNALLSQATKIFTLSTQMVTAAIYQQA
jgi:hypothetical protein